MFSKATNTAIGASLLVQSPTRGLYEAVLDVRNFPRWAPGVRRVEILEGYGEPGMISEWEICFLGQKRKFLSVLEEAESPALLRWTYDGLVRGWGQCVIRDQGESALAVFQTELQVTEPYLKKLMRMWLVREAASTHLKRCLAQLGRMISGDGSRVRVGPAEGIGQSLIPSEQPRSFSYASKSSRFRETLQRGSPSPKVGATTQAISEMPEQQEDEGKEEERSKGGEVVLVSHANNHRKLPRQARVRSTFQRPA